MNSPAKSKSLIFLFFFSSGFAALLYQIVWLKYLNLLFGSTTYATTATLSAFMFGLSIGSRLSTRFQPLFRNSLKSYGMMELGVGIFATIFPWLYKMSMTPFSYGFSFFGPESIWYSIFVFIVAFLALLIPTSLMGATLPLLAHAVVGQKDVGGKTGLLYAANTVGAVAGILCTAFWLIPTLGLKATIYVGVLINLVVGLVCFLYGNTEDSTPVASEEKPQTKGTLLPLYLVSGTLALGYEVLWTRILVLHLGSSVYAYAIMLAVFLIGISVGSLVAGKWVDRHNTGSMHSLFSWLQLAWALSILLQILEFSRFSDLLYLLASPFTRVSPGIYFLLLLVGTVLVLFLPTFFSGALFPVVVRSLWDKGFTIATASSLAYGYNTVGGIFGSLVAGFLLIPLVGTQTALVIFASMNFLLGAVAAFRLQKFRPILVAGIIFAVGAVLIQNRISLMQSVGIFANEGGDKLIHLEEDITSTITVEQRMYMNRPYLSLSVNGINVAGSSPQLITIQKMQGNIPMMLFGPGKPASVLHIGFGSGGTAYSVSLFPETNIQVVELSRAIVRNADASFRSENHGIVQSGKLQITYFDGRSYLQNTTGSYDVILSDSIHPRSSGNGTLYTKDYYELVKKRLRPGGVHSQWIPTYSLSTKNLKEIVRAFWEVFPETYVWYVNSTINPYIVVTGINGNGRISFSNFQKGMQQEEVRKDLDSIDVRDPYHILDYFLFGPEGVKRYVQDVDPHTDDRLTVEFESARVLNKEASWWVNYSDLLNYREPISRYIRPNSGFDPVMYNHFYEATSRNLDGQYLFLSGKRKEASRSFSEAAQMNPADRDPMEFSRIGF